jgi:hypothetical protein
MPCLEAEAALHRDVAGAARHDPDVGPQSADLNSALAVLWVALQYILDAFALGDRYGERIQILPETGRQGRAQGSGRFRRGNLPKFSEYGQGLSQSGGRAEDQEAEKAAEQRR